MNPNSHIPGLIENLVLWSIKEMWLGSPVEKTAKSNKATLFGQWIIKPKQF